MGGRAPVYKLNSNQQMLENLWPLTESNCDVACDSKGPKAKSDNVSIMTTLFSAWLWMNKISHFYWTMSSSGADGNKSRCQVCSQTFFLFTLHVHLPCHWLFRKMMISRETKISCHQGTDHHADHSSLLKSLGAVFNLTVLDVVTPSH